MSDTWKIIIGAALLVGSVFVLWLGITFWTWEMDE